MKLIRINDFWSNGMIRHRGNQVCVGLLMFVLVGYNEIHGLKTKKCIYHII